MLFPGKLETEFFGKARLVPANAFVDPLGFDLIEQCEVAIQHHAASAHIVDQVSQGHCLEAWGDRAFASIGFIHFSALRFVVRDCVSSLFFATGGAELGFFRPSKAARRAMPGHGRSLFADGGIAVVPYLYDNELVLRFDGVRSARRAFEPCAVPTPIQRGFHDSCHRFQRAFDAPCTRFQRLSNIAGQAVVSMSVFSRVLRVHAQNAAAPALRGCCRWASVFRCSSILSSCRGRGPCR